MLTMFESSVLSLSDESIDFSKICQSGIIVSILKSYTEELNKDAELDPFKWRDLSEKFLKNKEEKNSP